MEKYLHISKKSSTFVAIICKSLVKVYENDTRIHNAIKATCSDIAESIWDDIHVALWLRGAW